MKYVDEKCEDCKYCQPYEHRNTHYLRCVHPNWYRCKNSELYWPKTNEDKSR